MWDISIQALLNLGVIIIMAIIFHFMYILTLPSDMKLLKHLSDWTIGTYVTCSNPLNALTDHFHKASALSHLSPAGLAYLNLVYDWVKAAVMFGVINTVSRLDHLDPPKPPKCITMLYVFSETSVFTSTSFNHLFNVFIKHAIMRVDLLFKGTLIEESMTGSASKCQKIFFSTL